MQRRRVLLVIAMSIGVTVLHYTTAINSLPWHTVYRELYFVPIVLSGLWFGKKWGLANSILVSLVYVPHMIELIQAQVHMGPGMSMGRGLSSMSWDSLWGNGLQVVLFNVTGFLAGGYGDARRGFGARMREPWAPGKSGRDVLLYVDETPASLLAAHYVAKIFIAHRGQRITLLCILTQKDDEFFPDSDAAKESEEVHQVGAEESLNKVKQVFIDAGVLPEFIQEKSYSVQKRSRISDRILQELEEGDYHTIILGKHRLTKSEEFLFGSKAIRLVREAGVNVLAVKTPLDSAPEFDTPGPRPVV